MQTIQEMNNMIGILKREKIKMDNEIEILKSVEENNVARIKAGK